MANKKAAARPRRRGLDPRTTSLRVLLAPKEQAALKAAARATGLEVSTWLRQLGLREAGFLK